MDGSFGLVYIYAHTNATGVAIVCNIYRREKESKELKSPLWKWPAGSWALRSYCLPPARQDLQALISACSDQAVQAMWLLYLRGDPCQFSAVIFVVHRISEGIGPAGLPGSYWQIASHSSLFFLCSCFYSEGDCAQLWTSLSALSSDTSNVLPSLPFTVVWIRLWCKTRLTYLLPCQWVCKPSKGQALSLCLVHCYFPKCQGQSLTHSRHSISIWLLNKWTPFSLQLSISKID